jgi:hypothetical protein
MDAHMCQKVEVVRVDEDTSVLFTVMISNTNTKAKYIWFHL